MTATRSAKRYKRKWNSRPFRKWKKRADFDQFPAIVVDDESWHPGLAGLVAGRLKEKYGKPSCVITYTDNGKKEGKGSGRSVPGINIAKIFIDARNKGLLEKGGGHAMAGGFTVLPENIAALREFVYEQVKNQAASLSANSESHRRRIVGARLAGGFCKINTGFRGSVRAGTS